MQGGSVSPDPVSPGASRKTAPDDTSYVDDRGGPMWTDEKGVATEQKGWERRGGLDVVCVFGGRAISVSPALNLLSPVLPPACFCVWPQVYNTHGVNSGAMSRIGRERNVSFHLCLLFPRLPITGGDGRLPGRRQFIDRRDRPGNPKGISEFKTETPGHRVTSNLVAFGPVVDMILWVIRRGFQLGRKRALSFAEKVRPLRSEGVNIFHEKEANSAHTGNLVS
ncbi:hypothetical protein LZ31DRAFT_338981 [Colletotrichum somersetense]|nr:hypothetical protein LZ31DRAFT_338981 [Colletotrichum somersetense]